MKTIAINLINSAEVCSWPGGGATSWRASLAAGLLGLARDTKGAPVAEYTLSARPMHTVHTLRQK